jgi:hypothetical protein
MTAPTSASSMSLRAVVVLVAVSAPLALGFETLIRVYLFMPMLGADLAEVRAFFWPELTPAVRIAAATRIAWGLVGASLLAGLLGLGLLRRAAQRATLATSPAETARAKVRDRMLLLSSVPQIPAILATLCFSFGAELSPVLGSMLVSSAFVLGMGQLGESLLDKLAVTSSPPERP